MEKEENIIGQLPITNIKRDSDSMDDFEHLEHVVPSVPDDNVASDSDFNTSSVQLVDVPRAPKNLIDVAMKLERNILDTTVYDGSDERMILQPVPATPPPSADFEKLDGLMMSSSAQPLDPFARLQAQGDAKSATMAFMETERSDFHHETPSEFRDFDDNKEDKFRQDDHSPDLMKEPITQTDLYDSELNYVTKNSSLPIDIDKNDDKNLVFHDNIKSSVLPAPEKAPIMDFLNDDHHPTQQIDKDSLINVDNDSWNSMKNNAPTKPLPPLPKDEFENSEDKFEMTHDYIKAPQSGNETGDSEFESEPEPSPAKRAIKPITTVTQNEQQQTTKYHSNIDEKKFHDEIAPRKIFSDMGLGKSI